MQPDSSLFDQVFNTDHSEKGRASLLQEITRDHPYFSLAHFYLLKETALNDLSYPSVAATTALHLNNPFLLKFRLAQQELPAEAIASSPEEPTTMVDESIAEPAKEVFKEPMPMDSIAEPIEAVTVEPTVAETVVHSAPELKPAEKNEETLLFEPLHTTDYFASQGIKLSEEIQPTDKLGKQLKSFTDWLKTMKKVHAEQMPENTENIDVSVQRLAEKSNKEDEILTESMAEVYLQQGKPKKAVEIYQKLSLLNPSKSAYFAAKLEILKEK
ncbi:MAG TPA: hypothetical protein PLC48_11525 [Ferruginibacter sp.]|nr:hypothetical protein [Ferruginibacter sp.]